jgi:hypothetical protein
MSDDLVERIERWMCNRRGEDRCGCPSCVILAEAAAEIRSLREQVAKERAGIAAWLRSTGDWPLSTAHARMLADSIETQQDKEPQT